MAGIREMLAGYRRGAGTAQVVRDVLGMDLAQLDAQFDGYVRTRFANEMAAVKPRSAATRGDGVAWMVPSPTRCAPPLRSRNASSGTARCASSRRPSDSSLRTPVRIVHYRTLASIHLTRGDTAAAIRELQAMTARSETAYTANLDLDALLGARGDSALALKALDRAIYISPFDISLHLRLAARATHAAAHRIAVREREAVLALDPSDRVEAMYQLALAHATAGDAVAARREVLRTLDLAPNFEKAQALLLTLQEKRP